MTVRAVLVAKGFGSAFALAAAGWVGYVAGGASSPRHVFSPLPAAAEVPPFVRPCAPAGGELALETDVDRAPTPRTLERRPAQPAPARHGEPKAIAIAKNGNRAVRTPDDATLPAWVPIAGRLTVLESSDLAENLGLLPMGWAKAHPNEIASVAKLLEAERAERAAAAAAAPSPASAKGWTYIAGEIFTGL